MVLGYFGKTPGTPDPEIVKLAAEQLGLEPTTRNPREINDEDPAKGISPAKERLTKEGLPITDENIFIAASLKDKGIAFLKGDFTIAVRKNVATQEEPVALEKSDNYSVDVGGRSFNVVFKDGKAIVNGKTYDFSVAAGGESTVSTTPAGGGTPVTSKMPGKIITVLVSNGQKVDEGEALLKMEALKMEMNVSAPQSGVISEVCVKDGQQVAVNDVLVRLA